MIRRVAIFGAGTMGGGIALTCIKAGLQTTVVDTSPAALVALRGRIEAHLSREVQKARLTGDQADAAVECLTLSTAAGAAVSADLVIEAVFEDLRVKQDLLKRLEPTLRPDTIIATNTSCLLVRDVASVLDDPGRMLGLHYFSPAEVNPVVEVIAPPQSRPEVRQAALAFLSQTGKSALPCADRPGFALNRFFCPFCNEAVRLLDEGIATTGQIDAMACAAFGLAAGPFRVMNLIKPAILLQAIQSLSPLGPNYTPAAGLQAIAADAGRWTIEADPAVVPPDVARLLTERLTGAALAPALEALAEGVVQAPDLDRGAKAALRFERNPVVLRDTLPKAEVDRLVALATSPQKREDDGVRRLAT